MRISDWSSDVCSSDLLQYVDDLMDRLGLTTLLRARPQPAHLAAEDPDLDLAERDSDRCCYLRKTLPMISVLRNYDCVLTGRKRFQTAERAGMDYVEVQETWLRVTRSEERSVGKEGVSTLKSRGW